MVNCSGWLGYLIFALMLRGNQVCGKRRCMTDDQGRQQRCGQICETARYNYTCKCLPGYKLSADGHSCDVVGTEEPGIMFAVDSRIEVYLPERQISQIVLRNAGNITDFGLVSPKGVAVDLMTGTIYIVDTQPGTIIVCSLKGDNCSVLLRDLVNPQDIVVDPTGRRMFWTDWGSTGTDGILYGASIDGADQSPLAVGLKHPTQLQLDGETGAVFWLVETGGGPVVQMMYVDSDEKQGIHTFKGSHTRPGFLMLLSQLYVQELEVTPEDVNTAGNMIPGDVNIAGNRITEDVNTAGNMIPGDVNTAGNMIPGDVNTAGNMIPGDVNIAVHMKHEMVPGKVNIAGSLKHEVFPEEVNIAGNMKTRATEDFLNNGRIKMYRPSKYQLLTGENHCATSGCSHLCVHSNSNHGYRCLCPIDMELVSGVTCQKKAHVERLLTSGSRILGIQEIPLQYIGGSPYRPQRLVGGDVGCFAFGSLTQVIVFHNQEKYTLEVTWLHSLGDKKVLYENMFSIEGIALDKYEKTFYWSNRQGEVIRGHINGSPSEIIIRDLDKPRGLAVDQENSLLYICDWGRGQILRCGTKGPGCQPLVEDPAGQPNNVIIHTVHVRGVRARGLIWTDSTLDKIRLMPLDGSHRIREITLLNTRNPHPYALSASGDIIYYTDLNSGGIQILDQTRLNATHNATQDLLLGIGSLYSVAVFKYETDELKTSVVLPSVPSSTVLPGTEWKPVIISPTLDDTDDVVWIIGVVSGVIVVALAVTAAVFFYRQRQKRAWLTGVMRYVKHRPSEDAEQLMSHIAASNPSFHNFEDLDYPEYFSRRHHGDHGNDCPRGYSTGSMDSAFTEMQDFSTSSVDLAS